MDTFEDESMDLIAGLTSKEVRDRVESGLTNIDCSAKPKPVSEVLKKNFFTLFNLINLILFIMIMFTGSFRNLTFMFVVLSNSMISLFQELRARSATEHLRIVASEKAVVIRDSRKTKIESENVVKDDILVISAGDQIIVDCIVERGSCEVNESLLTGESNLIEKNIGDSLLSGSFIVSGQVIAKAKKVGKNTYSSKISRGLKNIQSAKSEIMLVIKKIIKIVSAVIIPIGILFFLNQMKIKNDYSSATFATSAALIGMIPAGLALLTSSVLALGATRLSKKKILAKDIYSVESLARIDTLCLDKTGTITEGSFEVVGTVSYKNLFQDSIKIGNFGDSYLFNALDILSSSFPEGNATFNAIKEKFKKSNEYKIISTVPFASHRKFSSVFVKDLGSFVMGSAEFILKDKFDKIRDYIEKYSDYRVLSVAHSNSEITKDNVPDDINLVGLVLLKDKIKKSASETISYFQNNNVDVKIISGDNVNTISNVAKDVGLKDYDKSIDVNDLKKHSDILKAVNKYSIFARVTPEKKREIVMALKSKGKCVGMIGDGVNDILALKEADCSVSMANGSSAARGVAHLILVNSDFSSVKDAVFEGRRAINNIQTTSSLFLVRTIYSAILTVIFLIFSVPYPFEPIQMTLVSTFTIGVPSFLLALEPNSSAIKSSLLSNMMKVSVPAAISVCINIVFCFSSKLLLDIPQNMYSTLSTLTTSLIGFQLLWKICQPLNVFRSLVFLMVSIGFAITFIFFGNLFSLVKPNFWEFGDFILFSFISFLSHLVYKGLDKGV